MTVWCVTGSRVPKGEPQYDFYEKLLIEKVCAALWSPGDVLITGGCMDVDALAMRFAKQSGLWVKTYLARGREFTDEEAVSKFSDEVIETGAGYWARDSIEVNNTDWVIAFPAHERNRSSRFSGTWHTWQCAVAEHKDAVCATLRPHDQRLFFGQDPHLDIAFRAIPEQTLPI